MQTRLLNLQNDTLRAWCLFADSIDTRHFGGGTLHLILPDYYVGLSHQHLNEYGVVQWETFLFRTVDAGEPYQDLPHVTPGGDLLCYTSGKAHAQTVKEYVAEIETSGIEPAHAGTLHRRAAPYLQHNRLPTRIIRDYIIDDAASELRQETR